MKNVNILYFCRENGVICYDPTVHVCAVRIRVQVQRTYVGDERFAAAPMLTLCMKVRKGSGPPVQSIAFTKTQTATVAKR